VWFLLQRFGGLRFLTSTLWKVPSSVDAKHIVGSCSRVRLKISRSHTLKADSDMGPAISSSIKHARLFDREQRWSKDLNATRDKKVVNHMTATTGYIQTSIGRVTGAWRCHGSKAVPHD